ncbi:MAG: hypothetical protein J5764_03575, partial [Bacteroidales bacterium]|nr:hypothetical protein [Bacteroidales bacterium]
SNWILFDFAVAARQEGFMDSEDGLSFSVNDFRTFTNDQGLITRDRKIKKDAFYLYKSWWNKAEETVYISSRRLKYRPAGQEFILTVYSNAPSLKIYCNGKEVADVSETGESTGVVWKIPVRMGDGPTTFKAVSPSGTADKVKYLTI